MKIILIGSSGAMGKVVVNLVSSMDGYEVIAGIQSDDLDQGFPYSSDFSKLNDLAQEADVIIDFSTPVLTDQVVDFALNNKLPLILATTGQNEEQNVKIEKASQIIPILNSHNTSIGVNVMEEIVQELTKKLYPLGYDVEIIEKHHRYKIDAPSGTAEMLLEAVEKNTGENNEAVYGREGISDQRQHNQIGMHSIRGGDIVGEHTVLFAANQEVIEITHRAGSKEIFAKGAIQAAEFLVKKESGLYDMHDAL